jgi:hypothetical protein
MAANIELAGLALAFPPLRQGATFQLSGAWKISDFWNRKLLLQNFARDLNTERLLFENTCKTLLEGRVSVDEMTRLLSGNGWDHSDLQDRLRERVGPQAAEVAKEIYSTLVRLSRNLGLNANTTVCILKTLTSQHI